VKQLPITQVGNHIIRSVSQPYSLQQITSKQVNTLVAHIKYTVRNVHGVGLAAPQVGVAKQLFVIRISPTKYRPDLPTIKPYAVFNPQILKRSKEQVLDYEGCFSVAQAGLFAKLPRANKVRVQYQDEHGAQVVRDLQGLEARIFQHEYDHLHGKVFLDHMPDTATFMSTDEYQAMRAKQATTHTTSK
jgi:peptide deformylase